MNGKAESFNKFVTQFKKGDTLYKKGEEQDYFYIINKGKVQIKLPETGSVLITLDKGDFFGEESLNEDQLAAYTVEVVEDSDIIKIPYSSLTEMMKKSSNISLKILKKLSEKNLKMLENSLSITQTVAQSVQKQSPPPAEATPAEAPTEEEDESALIDPSVKAYLLIKRSNRMVQITKKHTYLGRRDYTTGFQPDVDLTKEDEEKYISRKHSKISYINGKFYMQEEPGAVNGTFLNGTKLSTGVKHELKADDELTLCHLDIVFRC